MRKVLALMIVATMTATSFAYLPLSRWNNWNTTNATLTGVAPIANTGEVGLGSYQRAATQGMFYNELDIISADPVELLDFEGNNLYTTWSNARNAATSNAVYANDMSWGNYANNANCSRLLIGVSGDPLGYFNINGSRAGVVFQNYGSKAGANDLDSLMAAASGLVANAGNDMQFTWTYIDNIEDNAVTTGVVIDRNETQYADLKSYTNTTNSQWNAGIAKKDLFLKGLDCGFGLAHYGNSIVYNGGGVKSADNKYLTADGVTAAGMPAGSTQGNSATANYLDGTQDTGSNWATDLIFQGRLGILDNLNLQGTLGARFATTINPGGLLNAAGVAQGCLVTNGVAYSVSNDANIGGVQYFDTATGLSNITQFARNVVPTFANWNNGGMWNVAAPAIVDYSDKRTGMGPMIEAQGTYTGIEKVDLVGVVHFDSLKAPISAAQTNQEKWNKKANVSATQITNWDGNYVEQINSDGENTTNNLNVGGKIEFKALENMKLALGGFIYTNVQTNDFSKVAINTSESYVYSDGLAADNPGTVGIGAISGPAAATFGVLTGNGEGTWVRTISSEFSGQVKTESVTYSIPVGMEMPIYKDKWLFRAGTAYNMQKVKTSTVASKKATTTTIVATPAGGAAVTQISQTAGGADVADQTEVEYAETHTTSYTYGIQWNVNKNLTLAMNAVLDTNPNQASIASGAGATANATPQVNASIFDLDTYRLLSIQAVIHF
jgi:hypothetical protein